MSGNPLDALLDGLREAREAGNDPQTRIATVTGGSDSYLTVRFDGEAVASTRQYSRIVGAAKVGDRVIMLRVGSTWVALARLPTGTGTYADTGWITPGFYNGWVAHTEPVAYRRLNGIVYLRGTVRSGPLTTTCFILPVGFRPSGEYRGTSWGGVSSLANTYIDGTGNVIPYGGPGGEHSFDGMNFPADL